jgi:hypothetical protein
VGQTASRTTIYLYNSGTGTLTVSSITMPAGFSAEWKSGTVPAGGTQYITFQFAPTAVQKYEGTLTLTTDASVLPVQTFSMSGNGVAPIAGGQTSGKILDLQAAQDIIAYNQGVSTSFKASNIIARWELPIAVYVAPGFNIDPKQVEDATKVWQQRTGLTFVMLQSDVEPRILVRAGTDGTETTDGLRARGGIDGTYSNNRARSGIVVFHPDSLPCANCVGTYVHELGHAIGLLAHLPTGVDHDAREENMLRAMYNLPFGASVQPDGTWAVR